MADQDSTAVVTLTRQQAEEFIRETILAFSSEPFDGYETHEAHAAAVTRVTEARLAVLFARAETHALTDLAHDDLSAIEARASGFGTGAIRGAAVAADALALVAEVRRLRDGLCEMAERWRNSNSIFAGGTLYGCATEVDGLLTCDGPYGASPIQSARNARPASALPRIKASSERSDG